MIAGYPLKLFAYVVAIILGAAPILALATGGALFDHDGPTLVGASSPYSPS